MRERQTRKSRSGELVFDDRAFPIVLICLRGDLDAELVDQLFDWIKQLVTDSQDKKLRYALIFDALDIARPSPSLRGQIARRVDLLPPSWTSLNVGSHVLISSPVVRGALTALTWITSSKISTSFPDSLEAAIAKACVELRGAGIEPPLSPELLLGASARRAGSGG